MTLHRTLTGADLHALQRWEFADQTAMDAASGLESGDVGKVAWKIDDDTFYVLVNHSPATWTTLGGGRVKSTLLPDMTNASGTVSQIDIGSSTEKFKSIYVHDAHIDASSLYVNNKKVIEDDSGTITVKTDPNEDLKLLTTGTGDLLNITDNEFNTNAKGGVEITVPGDNATKHINITNASAGGNITFYSTGANSQVRFNASEEIDLTATTIDLNGNVDISGSLTLGGGGLQASDVGLGNVPNVDCTNASNITSGSLSSSVLPPIAITTVQTAANETAHLALTAQEGDVVVRTDESKSYIHNGGSAGTMTDYTELQTPSDAVLSVNGDTGTVILNQDDVGDGSTYVRTENNFTDARASKLDGMTPDTSASANSICKRDASGDIYANKVYNAVYNDLADFVNCLDETVQYGKCYRWTNDGGATICTEWCQKGVMGIASDTYGFALGMTEGKLPLAVSGLALAYVEAGCEAGDCLTNNADGILVRMTDDEKMKYPERILATYMNKEEAEFYGMRNEVVVNGRHWVKVK